VVFYPGSGDDGHPIKLFGASRAAFCFVYADQAGYEYGRDPTGYTVVLDEEVTWLRSRRPFNFNGTKPRSARWIIFQRQEGYGPDHGHEFIALLYVNGDAFTVYWDLWAGSGKAPYAILIEDYGIGGIFKGHPFGGPESPMYMWADAKIAWPNWLLVSEHPPTKPWPGYHRVSTGDPGGRHHDQRFLYSRRRR
jgi:hypothetical protein